MTELDLKMQELRRRMESMQIKAIQDEKTIFDLRKEIDSLQAQIELNQNFRSDYERYVSDRDMCMDLIIKNYGFQMQSVVAMEEMSELTKELSKALRGLGDLTAMAEEIADVQVMIWQMARMYLPNKTYDEIEVIACNKIKRQLERITKGE